MSNSYRNPVYMKFENDGEGNNSKTEDRTIDNEVKLAADGRRGKYLIPGRKIIELLCNIRRAKIPRSISEKVFFITFLWQLCCMAGLEIYNALTPRKEQHKDREHLSIVISIMVVLQLLNLCLCLSVSIKLYKEYKHKHTKLKFLVYSYIATLFLFGGVYTFIAWIYPRSFRGLRDFSKSKVQVLRLYSQLLFMSISTGTLCGSSGITAGDPIVESLMSIQMLLTFLCFTTMLSQVVSSTNQVDNSTEISSRAEESESRREVQS